MVNSRAYDSTFVPLMRDVQNLLNAHPSTGGTPGRPPGDTGPLLRSAIVLLHTAWENYVEQVALESFDFLLVEIGDDHQRLSGDLRKSLGSRKNPWSLAGNGWQTEARKDISAQIAQLNTPNCANVESLIFAAIGLADSLAGLTWQRHQDSQKNRDDLDEFVQVIRGEIVHKGTTPTPLHKGGVKSWISFIRNVAERLDDKISAHLLAELGSSPWQVADPG